MRKAILSIAAAFACINSHAQEADDCGLWLNTNVEKQITKGLKADVGVGFRTRNNFQTADRWDASAGITYKLTKWLKTDAEYSFLYTNRTEKLTYKKESLDDGMPSYNNWRPSFWTPRHRFSISLTGQAKCHNIEFSLRERWQYTYRPSAITERYDFDNEIWEDTDVSGKGKNILRSRLQIEYSKKKALLKPYANVEIFNSMALEKVRMTAGTKIRLSKRNDIEVYYRYQATNAKEENNEPNCHYFGAGYTFKL